MGINSSLIVFEEIKNENLDWIEYQTGFIKPLTLYDKIQF